MDFIPVTVTISPSGASYTVSASIFRARSGFIDAAILAQENAGWNVSSLNIWSVARHEPVKASVKLKGVSQEIWEHYASYVLEVQDEMPPPKSRTNVNTKETLNAELHLAVDLLLLCIQLDDPEAFSATATMLSGVVDDTGDFLAPPAFTVILGRLMSTPWSEQDIKGYSARLTSFLAEIAVGDYKLEAGARHAELETQLVHQQEMRSAAQDEISIVKEANAALGQTIQTIYSGEAVFKKCTVVEDLLKRLEDLVSDNVDLRGAMDRQNAAHTAQINRLCNAHEQQKLNWQTHITSELQLFDEEEKRKAAIRAKLELHREDIERSLNESGKKSKYGGTAGKRENVEALDFGFETTKQGSKRSAQDAELSSESIPAKRTRAAPQTEALYVDPDLLTHPYEKDHSDIFTEYTNF